MRLLLLLILSLCLSSCVAPTEELAPRGAAGVVTLPSPSTRGEPFVTSDGWTIRVERAALRGMLRLGPTSIDYTDLEQFGRSGPVSPNEMFFLNAMKSAEIWVPALPPVTYGVLVMLESSPRRRQRRGQILDIDDKTFERFDAIADNAEDTAPRARNGPSLVVDGSAEREGRVVRFAIAIEAEWNFSDPGFINARLRPALTVQPNELVSLKLPIAVEELFRTSDEGLHFDSFAEVDGVTPKLSRTYLKLLAARANRVFGPLVP